MRVRAALLILVSTWAVAVALAGAASALQIGPVQLPVTVPPIPALAPIVGTTPVAHAPVVAVSKRGVQVGGVVAAKASPSGGVTLAAPAVGVKVSPNQGVTVTVPDATVAISPTAGASIGVADPNVGVVVAPKNGVTIGVTIPKTIGPVTVPPVVPGSAQVTVGPKGVDVTTAPSSSGSGTIATPSAPAVSSPAALAPASPDLSAPAGSVPLAPARHEAETVTVGGATPAVASAANAHSSPTFASGAPSAPTSAREVAVPDAVNASLDHAAPGSTWTLAREVVVDRFALWVALLAILVVARWALSGLVRDARRKTRLVSSV